jgi:hypothetical protein
MDQIIGINHSDKVEPPQAPRIYTKTVGYGYTTACAWGYFITSTVLFHDETASECRAVQHDRRFFEAPLEDT